MCQKQDLMYKLREKTHSQSIAHCSKTEQTSSKQINAFKAVTFQSMSHCHTLVTNSKPFLSHLKGKKIGITIHSK